MLAQMPGNKLVAVDPDPDHGDLRAAIGIERGQMGERPGGHERADRFRDHRIAS
jgi:hypothetical protein